MPKGLSEASLDTLVKAVHRFEVSTKFRSLRKFHVAQAVAFRRQLSEKVTSNAFRIVRSFRDKNPLGAWQCCPSDTPGPAGDTLGHG